MSLYNKYRPRKFSEIVGNKEALVSLNGVLKKRMRPHVFLLKGPTGCGKTTLARIIAHKLGCKSNDINEVDAADFRGVDTVRTIRQNSKFKSMSGGNRMWILDECHQMTRDAQTALLKLLEDTPDHVYIAMCTTDPSKLLPTLRGRCLEFEVGILHDREIYVLLKRIVDGEKEKLSKNVYKRIISASEGHPRNAVQILEQVLSVSSKERLAVAERAEDFETAIIDLCRICLKQNVTWIEVARVLRGLKGENPENVRRAIMGYCSAVLIKGRDFQAAGFLMEQMKDNFYDSGFHGVVHALYSFVKLK